MMAIREELCGYCLQWLRHYHGAGCAAWLCPVCDHEHARELTPTHPITARTRIPRTPCTTCGALRAHDLGMCLCCLTTTN